MASKKGCVFYCIPDFSTNATMQPCAMAGPARLSTLGRARCSRVLRPRWKAPSAARHGRAAAPCALAEQPCSRAPWPGGSARAVSGRPRLDRPPRPRPHWGRGRTREPSGHRCPRRRGVARRGCTRLRGAARQSREPARRWTGRGYAQGPARATAGAACVAAGGGHCARHGRRERPAHPRAALCTGSARRSGRGPPRC
jgi:hypothetical protein